MFGRIKSGTGIACTLLAISLAGCIHDDPASRISLSWNERGTVYIADKETGAVLALAGSDNGRLLARSGITDRRQILDMQLDKPGEHLWILGTTRIDIHDARTLDLKASIPLDAYVASSLHLDEDGAQLYSRNGRLLGRVGG